MQTARATRAQLAGAPVPAGWVRNAVETQVRLAAPFVSRQEGLVHGHVGGFDVAGFSASSLAFLHHEIFVKLQYYFRARRPDPVVLDGGSNIGMSVLFFKALYPEASIVAFEPAAPAHRLLVRNVEANGLHDVEAHAAALGLENGTVSFYDEPDDPATFRMSTRRERLPSPRETTVSQRCLSDFVAGPVDLVKLDVEGAEDDVLADLIATGAIEKIDQLIVEYHHRPAGDDSLGEFLEHLRAHGFHYQLAARVRAADRANDPADQDVLVHAHRPV